jgi:DnaJ family protein B protein 12
MEVNKEEALRSLAISQKHLNASNLPSALKFAKKSISLYSTPEALSLLTRIEREIETGGSASTSTSTPPPSSSSGRTSGVEEHVTSASTKSRTGEGDKGKGKREYTTKQMEVVVRVKKCKHHEYYEILACECGDTGWERADG